MRRRSIVTLGVLFIIGGGIYAGLKSFDPSIGQATTSIEAPIEGLPKNSVHIRYHLPGSFGPEKAYEFDATESEFEAWVASLPPPKVMPSLLHVVHCLDSKGWPNIKREIDDGPVYSWQNEDQSIVVGFDRSIGRAFYYRSYR